jgi:hypothetical protein
VTRVYEDVRRGHEVVTGVYEVVTGVYEDVRRGHEVVTGVYEVVTGVYEVVTGVYEVVSGGHEAVLPSGDNPRRSSRFLARLSGMRRPFAVLLAVASLAAAAVSVCASPSAQAETPFSGRPILEARPPAQASPRAELVDDGQQTLPTFAHEGRRFVLGAIGERYQVHIVNPTASRIEAVISVDGLDAVDGRPASVGKRGYVIPAFGDVVIDGWRTSLDTVAAFRFSSVRDSFAARKDQDRNVGVIGVAFFRERPPVVWRPPVAWRGAAPSADKPSASAGAPAAPGAQRSGLGTQFGEAHDSRVQETSFVRADAAPMSVAELRYDDRAGLLARGITLPPRPGERWAENLRRDGAQPFPDSRFAQPPR